MTDTRETFEERVITYTLQLGDRFILIENVPCRVCLETGEQLFTPDTAEWIRKTIWSQEKPVRIIETEVFDFANRNATTERVPQSQIRMGV